MLGMPQEMTRARNCRSSLRCSGCGGRHHASICFATHGDSNSTLPDFAPRSPQLQKIQTTNPDSHTPHPVGTSISKQQSNIINMNTTVLFQTATTTVYPVDRPANGVIIRLILTSGSLAPNPKSGFLFGFLVEFCFWI